MSIYEQILNSNIINFLIVITTLGFIFKTAGLGELIEQAANDIKSKVEKSSTGAQNAISEYKTIRKQTKDTPMLQEEIISNAKNSAQNLKENINQKTKLTVSEIKESLEKIYASQGQKQKNLLLKDVYNACVDMAVDEVKEGLSDETQKKLINISIDELDKIQGGIK